MSSAASKIRANGMIRVPKVRLIGPEGEQLGILGSREALDKAREYGLDLVEVAGNTSPPVCRILDLGKYLYAINKKEKESRKKQKVFDVKEIKMTPKIDDHDYETKLRNARRFLERGDKVKFTIFFRGREIMYQDRAVVLINKFKTDLADLAELERNDGLEGKQIHMYFQPSRKTPKKPAEAEGQSTGASIEAVTTKDGDHAQA